MKKERIVFVCLFLAGCQNSEAAVTNPDTAIYQSYYQDLYAQTDFSGESSYFKTNLEMAETENDTFAYAVIIDEPAIAMYSIHALVLEDDIPYEDNEKMMPSSGIFDKPYSMIPNQVNKAAGYAKGIVLRGDTEKNSVEIRLLVEWRTEDNETMREYMRWQLDENDAVPIRS